MKKYSFSTAERYSVWLHYEKRCWLCNEPLRFKETTIDHVVPESLIENEEDFRRIVEIFALPPNFQINGFENWLPCCNPCNQKKSNTIFDFAPVYKIILDRLISNAPKVGQSVAAITRNITKDKLFAQIFAAFEKEKISLDDLVSLVNELGGGNFQRDEKAHDTSQFIRLENGYWLHKKDVVKTGICACERITCVDQNTKVVCVWPNSLSDWAIHKHLYKKCYDEILLCPRCNERHERGNIGRLDFCKKPFKDQIAQND